MDDRRHELFRCERFDCSLFRIVCVTKQRKGSDCCRNCLQGREVAASLGEEVPHPPDPHCSCPGCTHRPARVIPAVGPVCWGHRKQAMRGQALTPLRRYQRADVG